MLAGYCVRRVGEPGPPPGTAGLGGGAVRVVEAGGLGVWLSEAEPAPATLERVREHGAVVRAALRSATPLPLRYGTLFRDEEEARATLLDRESELRAALERVAGRVEMGIRAVWDAPEPAPAATGEVRSGTEYLERRREEMRAREAREREAAGILDRIEACFATMELPSVRAVAPFPGVAGTLAHLVQGSELHRYRVCADEARNAVAPVRLELSGPWAPYSFV